MTVSGLIVTVNRLNRPFIAILVRSWNSAMNAVGFDLHFDRIFKSSIIGMMVKDGLKFPGHIFWWFQITGWLLYWVTWSIFNFYPSLYFLIFTFIYVLPGFAITLLMRHAFIVVDMDGSISRKLIIIAASVIIGANLWYGLDLSIDYALLILFGKRIYIDSSLINYLKLSFYWAMILLTWSGLYFSLKYVFEWNIQKHNSLRAEMALQDSKLDMIKYQINPHFLFNTLNAVRALIKESSAEARTLVTALSEFMRYPLINRNVKIVPLRTEIEALKNFLIIEKYRFEEKLDYAIKIDPLAEDFPVISFLLYPLVESNLSAGMQLRQFPVKLSIEAKATSEKLTIIINSSNISPGEDPRKSFLHTARPGFNDQINQLIQGAGQGKCTYSSVFTTQGASFIVTFEKDWDKND